MKKIHVSLAVFVLCQILALVAMASSAGPGISADEAMARLKDGNGRFVSGAAVYIQPSPTRRRSTALEGQKPFATVLSCADSRVPVELLFDQGVGDVFVIRVAGNVANVDELGTIEYGAEHLGVPLLVVLGHTKCGAVTAVTKGEEVHGNIAKLVAPIVPAVAEAKARFPKLSGGELVEKAIVANVWQAVSDVFANSPVVKEMVKAGKVKVVGAMYDIDSGKVEFLGEHPRQAELTAG